jgi:hypothetical protein
MLAGRLYFAILKLPLEMLVSAAFIGLLIVQRHSRMHSEDTAGNL